MKEQISSMQLNINYSALVCCSNGIETRYKETIEQLKKALSELEISTTCSPYIYQRESVFSGTGIERADSLMNFFLDDNIDTIFDVSGGDIGNEILPFLDYDKIASSKATYWGYSDLTTVINAIYAKTDKSSVLYQICNLVGTNGESRRRDIKMLNHTSDSYQDDLFDFDYEFIQQTKMEGIVVGGNIRCFLKLAGTPYFPSVTGKILFLESKGGEVAQMVTYLNQLSQMGVFEQVNGILLGTFTQMERNQISPSMIELVKRYVADSVPIAYTKQIGHVSDSKALRIGERMILR